MDKYYILDDLPLNQAYCFQALNTKRTQFFLCHLNACWASSEISMLQITLCTPQKRMLPERQIRRLVLFVMVCLINTRQTCKAAFITLFIFGHSGEAESVISTVTSFHLLNLLWLMCYQAVYTSSPIFTLNISLFQLMGLKLRDNNFITSVQPALSINAGLAVYSSYLCFLKTAASWKQGG